MTADLDDGVRIGGKLVRFKKREIPDLIPPSLWDWLHAWLIWRDKQLLPLDRSWANHPDYFVETIRLMDGAYSQSTARRREKNRGN